MLMLHVVLSETVNGKAAASSASWKIDSHLCKPTQAPWVSNISPCSCLQAKQRAGLCPHQATVPISSAVPALVIRIWPGGFCWARLMLVPSPATPPRPEMTAVGHSHTEAAPRLQGVLPHGWAVGHRDKPLGCGISLQVQGICPLTIFSSLYVQTNPMLSPSHKFPHVLATLSLI